MDIPPQGPQTGPEHLPPAAEPAAAEVIYGLEAVNGVSRIAEVMRTDTGENFAGTVIEDLSAEQLSQIKESFRQAWLESHGYDITECGWEQISPEDLSEYFETARLITGSWSLQAPGAHPTDPRAVEPHVKAEWVHRGFPVVSINGVDFPITSPKPTGVLGMAYFERLGTWPAADAITYAVDNNGNVHLLAIERQDRPGMVALPGGQIEEGEDPRAAAVREMLEEAFGLPESAEHDTPPTFENRAGSLGIMPDAVAVEPWTIVADPRNTDTSCASTVPCVTLLVAGAHNLTVDNTGLPVLAAGSDASKAVWIPVNRAAVADQPTRSILDKLAGTNPWYASHSEYVDASAQLARQILSSMEVHQESSLVLPRIRSALEVFDS